MNTHPLILGSLLVAAGSIAGSAHADLKYTTVIGMGGAEGKAGGQGATGISITTAIKQGAQRTETITNMGPVKMNQIELTFCDNRKRIRLEPSLKIYTTGSMDGSGDGAGDNAGAPAVGANAGEAKEQAGTGKIITTATVQDLGEETIATFKTRHYMLNNRLQTSGCAGNSDTTMKMEVWVADIREPNACKGGSENPIEATRPSTSGCKITFETHGDTAAHAKAFDGLIMRMKMYNGDKATTVREITMLSQAKLEDDLFTVPADYKEVSAEEFQKAQTQAMMKSMMDGMKAGQGADAGDDAGDDDAEGKDAEEGDNTGDAKKDEGKEDEEKKEDEQQEEEKKPEPKQRKRPRFKLPF